MKPAEFVEMVLERLNTEEGFRLHEEEHPEFNNEDWRKEVMDLLYQKDKLFSDANNSFGRVTKFHQWCFRLNVPGKNKTASLRKYPFKFTSPESRSQYVEGLKTHMSEQEAEVWADKMCSAM